MATSSGRIRFLRPDGLPHLAHPPVHMEALLKQSPSTAIGLDTTLQRIMKAGVTYHHVIPYAALNHDCLRTGH
jgi:hypothetical protein